MDDPSDDIDEVALNVLLAEGVDFPTAWEASRRDVNDESKGSGCLGLALWLVVAFSMVVVAL
jgi:hypothetical protein